MKKRYKTIIGLWMSAITLGFSSSFVMAQESSTFLEQSFISDRLFDENNLPSIDDLDSLSEEELQTLYERLLRLYKAYEDLPAAQKAKYASFFNRLEALLTWLTSQAMPLEESQTIFRLYNLWSGEHLFTGNLEEIQSLLKTGWWKMEGAAWRAPSVSQCPVYRVMDPITLEHFYTMNEEEYTSLEKRGFQGEGIGFYSASSDQKPLYRLFNPNALFGAHHYTEDLHEREVLLSQGWKDEGIAWYGLNSSNPFEDDSNSFQDMVEESASN